MHVIVPLQVMAKILKSTVCPRSSGPCYIVIYYNKMGHYFLDTQYLLFVPKGDGILASVGHDILPVYPEHKQNFIH